MSLPSCRTIQNMGTSRGRRSEVVEQEEFGGGPAWPIPDRGRRAVGGDGVASGLGSRREYEVEGADGEGGCTRR